MDTKKIILKLIEPFLKKGYRLFIIGTTIKDLKEKFLKAMNSAEETESLTDMALGNYFTFI